MIQTFVSLKKNMKHPGQYLINHVYLNDQSRVGLGRSLAVEGDYA